MNTLLELFIATDLPQHIKDVLVGCILGDCRMNFTSFASRSFYFEQGILHKEYLIFLFSILSSYISRLEPTYRKYVDKRNGKIGESFFFTVNRSKLFGVFAGLFYKPISSNEGYVKIIPWDSMFYLLTPRALAFWIMDDGQYVKRGGVTLCTDNYSFEDVFTLMLVLEMKFGLVCSIHTKDYSNRTKKYYRIYISGTCLPLLRSLVAEHMHPSMMYKLDK